MLRLKRIVHISPLAHREGLGVSLLSLLFVPSVAKALLSRGKRPTAVPAGERDARSVNPLSNK